MHKNVKKAAWAVAAVLAVYCLVGFLILPFAGKKIILDTLHKFSGCTAGIHALKFNPFTLESTLEGLEINDSGQPAIKVNRFYVNLSALSLVKLAPVVTAMTLDGPQVFVVLDKKKQINLVTLFDGPGDERANKNTPDPPEASPAPFRFRLSGVAITHGRVEFKDALRGTTQVVDNINLSLPTLTSLKGEESIEASPVIRLGLNGAPVEIKLDSLPFDHRRDTQIRITAKDVDLAAAAPYLTLPPALAPVSFGRLTLALSARYHTNKDPKTPGEPGASHVLGADLNLTVKNMDFRLKDKAPLFSCPEFTLDATSKNLLSHKVTIKNVALNQAEFNLERDSTGQLAVMGLFGQAPENQAAADHNPDGQARTAPQAADTDQPQTGAGRTDQKPDNQTQDENFFHVTVNRGGLNNATFVWTDRFVADGFTTSLSDVSIAVTDLEAGPDSLTGSWQASCRSEASEQLATQGTFNTGVPLTVQGKLDLKDILAEKYRPYYASYGGEGLTIGKTGLTVGFHFTKGKDTAVWTVEDSRVALTDIQVQGPSDPGPVLDMKSFECSGIQVDSMHKTVSLGTVTADAGFLNLERSPEGNINLVERISSMVPPAPKDGDSSLAPPPEAEQEPLPGTELSSGPEDAAGPWVVSLGQFDLKNYGVSFADHVPESPAALQLSDIHLTGQGLTTAQGGKGRIIASMVLAKEGKLTAAGDFSLSPLAGTLDLDFDKIPVAPFQPYITDSVNLVLAQGHMGTKGRLSLSTSQSEPTRVGYTGTVFLNDFESKTQTGNNDFFKCKSLYLTGMDVQLTPLSLTVDKIALTDFYQKILISKSGQLNLSDIAGPGRDGGPKEINSGKTGQGGASKGAGSPDTKAAASHSDSGPMAVNIGAITLQGGQINFADYHNTPGFVADMTRIGGSVKGLSTLETAPPATVVLKGIHSGHAPLDISGRIDPFKQKKLIDLDISFKNIEMPEFTAYSKKYLGYGIQRGKLILKLNYNIQGDQLKSSNHVFFDQLSLGNRVKSPDATGLPIELAISLLKNSKNEIRLDVPIQGDLSDPEFKYGSVVVTTLRNLILSVVTAPFKFLGSIIGIGNGQDLGFANFSAGSDVLDEQTLEKIMQLSKILVEKDRLNIEIDSAYNPETDLEQIRMSKYRVMLEDLAAQAGLTVPDIETLTPEQTQQIIDMAYDKASFPKPMDKEGKEKQLSLDEKQKLLITAVEVPAQALVDLARRRSRNIRDYMVNEGGVASSRIFINDPDSVNAKEARDNTVKTRFTLK